MRWLMLCLLSLPCLGATYYVDFDGGSDANSGTATNAAWKTIPGTRTTDGTAFLTNQWGSFTSSARVPDNTTFSVKSGTTHDGSKGGYVWMAVGSGHFYDNGCTNLAIEVNSAWGSGPTVIDGAGMTAGIALMLIQIDGVHIQGFTIQNAQVDGIQFKERLGTGEMITNIAAISMVFTNNGLQATNDLTGSGLGHLAVKHAYGVTISNCAFEGNGHWLNGLLMGESHKLVQSATVVNCFARNHIGDLPNNDSGIGFKALNGQVTFSNCVSTNNLKGFDCGEINGDNNPITYTIVNCQAKSNIWGIGLNAVAAAYAGAVNFYVINSLVESNAIRGVNAYAGPFNLHVVHNVFAHNGGLSGSNSDDGQMRITPNSGSDSQTILAHVYNNALICDASAPTAMSCAYFEPATNNFTLDFDWNGYASAAGSNFFLWSYNYNGPTSQASSYAFGTNGPGHSSGGWYTNYGKTATPPTLGTGHYHCDPNSKGSGASDTTLPPLNALYFPTNHYAGTNLSAQSWYIAAMGTDRAGRTRASWDIGAYEYWPYITNTMAAPQAGHARQYDRNDKG